MKEAFKPSPYFVAKVMTRVHAYHVEQASFFERFIWSRQTRFLLAGSGTVFGILKAVPVF
jgi:hypothetical protein